MEMKSETDRRVKTCRCQGGHFSGWPVGFINLYYERDYRSYYAAVIMFINICTALIKLDNPHSIG
jgi:hypothetical protein